VFREEQPGQPYTVKQTEHWSGIASQQYFKAKEEDPKPAPIVHTPERLHALDWIRCLDNCLRAGLEIRLYMFFHSTRDQEKIEESLSDGTFSGEILRKYGGCLVMCMDKGSPQFAAANFLRWGLHMRFISLWDPSCHGLWNCCKLACKEAGWTTIMSECAILVNFRAARPYSKSVLLLCRRSVFVWAGASSRRKNLALLRRSSTLVACMRRRSGGAHLAQQRVGAANACSV